MEYLERKLALENDWKQKNQDKANYIKSLMDRKIQMENEEMRTIAIISA